MEAFWDLSSCRPASDYGVHPIPWRDIVLYADVRELDPEVFHTLRQVIREMDRGYIEFVASEMERKREAKAPKKDTP